MRLSIRLTLFLIISLSSLAACSGTDQPSPHVQQIVNCSPKGEGRVQTQGNVPHGAEGDWPLLHGDLKRDGGASTSGGSHLTLSWTYCTGAAISSSPIVHAGVVYIGSTDSTLTALNVQTGKMLWNIQTDAALYSTPIIQDGVLYICSLDGTIYAVDAQSGYTRWRTHAPTDGAKIWSSPVVADGLLLVGVASTLQERQKIPGQLLAFDIHTGKLRWQIFVQANHAPGAGVWSSPAVDATRHVVYVGTGDPDDGVLALNIQDGSTRWHWRSTTHDVSDTDVGSGPMLYTDRQGREHVTVGGKDGLLYSLAADNGQVLWKTQIGEHIFSSPAFANGTIYAVAVQGQSAISQALDASTGAIRWRHSIPTIVYASPAISGQSLFVAIGNGFGPGDGGVQVLNASTGRLLQYADLHSTASSSPAVLPSWLFVGSSDGRLNAFIRS